jgi:hypothetical protein
VTAEELGALLWLLALPEPATLRLGLGKPLGFGAVAVQARWDEVKIMGRDDLRERYKAVANAAPSNQPTPTADDLVAEYDKVLRTDASLRGIRDQFLDAAFGFTGAAVHYPRFLTPEEMARPAESDGEAKLYEWWVANESGRRDNEKQGSPRRVGLPPLGRTGQAPVLPYTPYSSHEKGQAADEPSPRSEWFA